MAPMFRPIVFILILLLLRSSFAAPVLAAQEAVWETAAPALSARTEIAAAALNGKIYVIGGFKLTGATRGVERYDPVNDQWEARADLPDAVHHAGAAVVEGKLYVVGGFGGLFSWTPSNKLWVYDERADHWMARKDMPTARGALGVAVWQGQLYAIGGLGEGGEGKMNVDANEAYDPVNDAWTRKAPLPLARDHLAAAEFNGKIHAIGGRFDSAFSKNLDRHDIYDPKTDQWIAAAPLPKPRSGIAAAVLHGKIHVFGGEEPAGTFSDNDAYDPKTDRWQASLPMPTARHGLGAVTLGEKIYVISGGPTPGGSRSTVNEVFSLQ